MPRNNNDPVPCNSCEGSQEFQKAVEQWSHLETMNRIVSGFSDNDSMTTFFTDYSAARRAALDELRPGVDLVLDVCPDPDDATSCRFSQQLSEIAASAGEAMLGYPKIAEYQVI